MKQDSVKSKKIKENDEIKKEISQINFYESQWLNAYDSIFKESKVVHCGA